MTVLQPTPAGSTEPSASASNPASPGLAGRDKTESQGKCAPERTSHTPSASKKSPQADKLPCAECPCPLSVGEGRDPRFWLGHTSCTKPRKCVAKYLGFSLSEFPNLLIIYIPCIFKLL